MTDRPRCPADRGQRKTYRDKEADSPKVSIDDGVWHIRSLPLVAEVLRDGRNTRQAGFNAESVVRGRSAIRPILYLEGEAHRDQRSKIARYFAPTTVAAKYRDFMHARADELVTRMRQYGEVELSDVAMRFSVGVAAQVIGLGACDRGNRRQLLCPGRSRR